MSSRSHSKWLLGVVLALALGACQAVAGIEDRVLDPNANTGGSKGGGEAGGGGEGGKEELPPTPASPECQSYCNRVMAACQNANAVYSSQAMCLGVCAALEPGDPIEPVGNTLACRANQAKVAELEPDDTCRSAGPGGDGECGSDCEAYCGLYAKLCPDSNAYPTQAACVQACAGLVEQKRFNLKDDHEGDTIECRLVHVSSAALKPDEHCPHAPIPPTEPWCTGKADAAPSCEDYCRIQLVACQGALTQYETEAQCLAVCGAFAPGTNEDGTGNSIGCRRYHSFSATLAAEQHCPHSGPTGDGHCGDKSKVADGHTGNCESYCTLLAEACPIEFDTAMGDAATCMEQCILLDEAEPESKYTLAKAKKSKGLHCRVLNAARSFDDPTACSAAIGSAPCL